MPTRAVTGTVELRHFFVSRVLQRRMLCPEWRFSLGPRVYQKRRHSIFWVRLSRIPQPLPLS